MNELDESDAPEEQKIREAFYRGVWTTLFLIANNHEPGFLEKEVKAIRDFHEKIKEREEIGERKRKGD